MADCLENAFDTTFNIVYHDMIRRNDTDPHFTKQHLQEMLQSLYSSQDNNWEGRGEAKAGELAATIAACEAVFYDWKEE